MEKITKREYIDALTGKPFASVMYLLKEYNRANRSFHQLDLELAEHSVGFREEDSIKDFFENPCSMKVNNSLTIAELSGGDYDLTGERFNTGDAYYRIPAKQGDFLIHDYNGYQTASVKYIRR